MKDNELPLFDGNYKDEEEEVFENSVIIVNRCKEGIEVKIIRDGAEEKFKTKKLRLEKP
jgi:hypothetical protein